MKKKISFIILLIGIFLLSGCTTDSMENINIYTSIYIFILNIYKHYQK